MSNARAKGEERLESFAVARLCPIDAHQYSQLLIGFSNIPDAPTFCYSKAMRRKLMLEIPEKAWDELLRISLPSALPSRSSQTGSLIP